MVERIASFLVKAVVLTCTRLVILGDQFDDAPLRRKRTSLRDPKSPYSGVISIFAGRLLAGQGLTIDGAGRQTRDFVYVADVVRHLIAGMAHANRNAPVFNVCTGRRVSILALAEAMAAVLDVPLSVTHGPPRAGDIPDSLGDPSAAAAALHIRAEQQLEAGLKLLLTAP